VTRPEDKPFESIMDLPEPIRQAVLDFMTVSARTANTPEALAEELVDSIGLKFSFAAPQRH